MAVSASKVWLAFSALFLKRWGQIPPVAVGLLEETIFAFSLHTVRVIVDTGVVRQRSAHRLLIPTVVVPSSAGRYSSRGKSERLADLLTQVLLSAPHRLTRNNTTSY